MKKLLFVVTVMAALSLLVLGSAVAEPTNFNEIGLYTTPDGFGETGTDDTGVPVSVYLVLTKPAAQNVPCFGVGGFECQLNFNPIGGIFLLSGSLPGNSINIGDVDHINLGYLEYIVGFGSDIPVVSEAVVLVTFSFLNQNAFPVEVTLGPVSNSSIPGHMAFLPPDPPLEIMYSMGGSHEAPVFIFNGRAVPVESESFGSVKALYR